MHTHTAQAGRACTPRFSELRVRILGETTQLGIATEAAFSVESIVRGYHAYKDVWAAFGET